MAKYSVFCSQFCMVRLVQVWEIDSHGCSLIPNHICSIEWDTFYFLRSDAFKLECSFLSNITLLWKFMSLLYITPLLLCCSCPRVMGQGCNITLLQICTSKSCSFIMNRRGWSQCCQQLGPFPIYLSPNIFFVSLSLAYFCIFALLFLSFFFLYVLP